MTSSSRRSSVSKVLLLPSPKCSEGYQKVVPVDDPTVECCACDQAKYELEFMGLWSKDTHPKDYPSRELLRLSRNPPVEHLTHFTDMLGASHSSNYSLWRFGDISTDGMKEIAEWGNTYKGEQEMKAKVLFPSSSVASRQQRSELS